MEGIGDSGTGKTHLLNRVGGGGRPAEAPGAVRGVAGLINELVEAKHQSAARPRLRALGGLRSDRDR